MERVISVPNETEASFTRNTCDGRRLTYKLKVLQQPERARACGSGAKSSADRRPVDPPPIVELRIYDGPEKPDNDITFSMNANYFLFATLEQARPIAQGRVPNDPARLTVLTGTPVAGMVYLDRPEPAGYFIFPDLSVRHEGKYRLGFSLYEELKEPKDADQLDEASAAAQGEAQITHRLEVKSVPFIVFSAKKFPGLAQSTQLSRCVADQGCRVRIRRDARMRRRETKGNDHDGYSDRARHSATPDLYQSHMAPPHAAVDPVNRERSASIASHASLAAAPVARRSSGHEAMQAYSQPSYPPQPLGQAPIAHQMPPAQAQYSQAPSQQYAQQHYAPQSHSMQPPQMQPPPVHYQQYQYPQASAPPPSAQPTYYGYAPAMQQPQYEESGHGRNMSIDYSSDSRRASLTQAPMYANGSSPSQTYPPQYSQNGGYTPQQTPKPRQMSQVSMSNGSSGAGQHILPPINTALVPRESKLEISPPSSAMSQTQFYDAGRPIEAAGHMGGKRSYDRVFDTRHLNAPLRQGARPSVSYAGGAAGFIASDDGHDNELAELESLKMSYRRADGREIARPLPPSHD